MAQVQLGPLVADIAGSIAGTTFQRWGKFHIIRKKPLPINRRNTFTNDERQATAYLTNLWRQLTAIERAAWNASAALITWSDRFGNTIVGKGYWLFLRCNQNLRAVAEPYITTPVAPFAMPAIASLSAVAKISTSLVLSWATPSPIPAATSWLVSATPPLSNGRSSGFSAFRIVKIIPTAKTSPNDIWPGYIARFPQDQHTSQQVFIRVQQIDTKGGYTGPPATISTPWV